MRYDHKKQCLVPESKPARAIRRGNHGVCVKNGIVGESIANMKKNRILAERVQ